MRDQHPKKNLKQFAKFAMKMNQMLPSFLVGITLLVSSVRKGAPTVLFAELPNMMSSRYTETTNDEIVINATHKSSLNLNH